MNAKGSMAGWIGFAGVVLFIVGGLNMFQGLVAIFDDEYFIPTRAGFLLVDLTTWGWVMMIWGFALVIAGFALQAGIGWARWFTIVIVALNFFAQLGFLGNSEYPVWSLTLLALNVIVLYALTVRWSESKSGLIDIG
jgi:hypothetical protein